MQSPDHPQLAFVQAEGYTKGRPDGPPLWVVVHDMEASETTTRAESTADYFEDPPDGRNVSSHYCADVNSVVQCVLLKDTAWTVGNRPGNNRGINWELAGFASQSRAQWLDDYGLGMFAQIVPIIQADAAKFGIPLERRAVDELKAFLPGITSHNDLRLAFGGTTHTDPGSNFPWDYFLDLLNGEDMTPEQAQSLQRIESYVFWETLGQRDPIVVPGDTVNHPPNKLAQQLAAIRQTQAAQQAQLDRIEALLSSGGGGFVAHEHTTDGGTPT
jgi:N-acetylmuramoyl-L-alanine amidase-like protein